MESAEVIEVVRQGIYVLIIISAPLMIVALVVGLAIALLQALTQVQEATLTFVPKVLAMLIMLAITLPFIIQTLTDYNTKLQEKIVHIQ
ncbi:MAG: flagellar biosynthesis protein FliQ [Pseudomonadota bacterium]|nr:flagellar biosynthesis protein FliQ [Pseudomonadota bacterium]MDE3038693.1 flagellar biosynthesis protein FliQ [Pseudomonadota bacterium]